ncbi:MAG: AraC family transcriptional regulator ligand-binding domain-containing protein [Kofleriaceae bacterium]
MHTISAVIPFSVAAMAKAAGVAGDLLETVGLRPDAPPRPEDHIDAARYFDVWRRAMAHLDAAFPVRVAAAAQLEDHELFGFLAISCETLGQAYERTATYRALYCVGARWELQIETDATRLIWYPWPGDLEDAGYRAAMDFALADMAHAIHRLGCDGPRPIAVRLRHAPIEATGALAAHYGVEPSFDAPLYELVYSPGLTDQPIATFNSRLRDYFDGECRRLISVLDRDPSMLAQVRKVLIGAMDGGDTTIETIARRLGTSSRSLQRRLADEGTRYNDVLADVRAEFAKRYLARGTISASEVAYLLGFTEPPAFFKAFKRWTGMTPREFQLAGATP